MWKNLELNSNSVKVETANSLLIKVPNSKFVFWHPKKLCRFYGKNNYLLKLGYTDDFSFNLFRNGEGKFNKYEKIEEKTISAQDFVSKYF